MARRIGIMGGTFDPIHLGHLVIAEESRYRFGLERVIFVPAGDPPHKPGEPVSDREHRYAMTALATMDNPAFEASRIEIDRPGPSYSVDTLTELKAQYNDAELFFITGADAAAEIMTWHEPEKLIELCTIIAATRPGYKLADIRRVLPEVFVEQIVLLDAPGVLVSSTDIRSRTAADKPIRYLVPDAVQEYICKNGLYGINK